MQEGEEMNKEDLTLLNERIRNAELSLLDLQGKIDKAEGELKLIELKEKVSIEDELDDKGKKIFSNETARKVELESRLKGNHGYQDLSEIVENLKLQMKRELIELDFKKRSFRIEEVISRQGV